jgi:hypothetical protein
MSTKSLSMLQPSLMFAAVLTVAAAACSSELIIRKSIPYRSVPTSRPVPRNGTTGDPPVASPVSETATAPVEHEPALEEGSESKAVWKAIQDVLQEKSFTMTPDPALEELQEGATLSTDIVSLSLLDISRHNEKHPNSEILRDRQYGLEFESISFRIRSAEVDLSIKPVLHEKSLGDAPWVCSEQEFSRSFFADELTAAIKAKLSKSLNVSSLLGPAL